MDDRNPGERPWNVNAVVDPLDEDEARLRQMVSSRQLNAPRALEQLQLDTAWVGRVGQLSDQLSFAMGAIQQPYQQNPVGHHGLADLIARARIPTPAESAQQLQGVHPSLHQLQGAESMAPVERILLWQELDRRRQLDEQAAALDSLARDPQRLEAFRRSLLPTGGATAQDGDPTPGGASAQPVDHPAEAIDLESLPQQFPVKLFRLLLQAERENMEDVICFSHNGLAFHIHDRHRFASELIPQYFRHNSMASFRRQLYLYGFTKVEHGRGYRHDLFRKSRPDLLPLIRRRYEYQGR